MKEGLLERIRSFAYWRVNLRPLQPLADKLSLRQCLEETDRARVSIRGWDFPHMSSREDQSSGVVRAADYLENWCDWHTQIEFWRMYRSGQFLAYKALYDDVAGPQGMRAEGRVVGIMDAIDTITEFIEFGHRLHTNGLYEHGFEAIISLEGSQDRGLWVGPSRMPFFMPMEAKTPTIRVERVLDPTPLSSGAIDNALSILIEFFEYFGWSPDPNQIRADQEKFYRRDFR